MKNWIIALAILIIPMIAYFVLDKNQANQAAFEAQAVSAMNKPVIIKFASPMCLDCKKLEGVVNEVFPKYADKITLQKVNAQSSDDVTKSLIQKYNVTLVPTMVFLKKDGKVYKRTEGFMNANEFEKLLKGLING